MRRIVCVRARSHARYPVNGKPSLSLPTLPVLETLALIPVVVWLVIWLQLQALEHHQAI